MRSLNKPLEKSIDAIILALLLAWFSFVSAVLVSQLYAIENASLREKVKHLEIKLKESGVR